MYGKSPIKNVFIWKRILNKYNTISFLSFFLSIWVKPQQQERLETFQEIQVMLTSGEGVRWVVNIKGCKCPPDPPYCGYGFVGDTIKGCLLNNCFLFYDTFSKCFNIKHAFLIYPVSIGSTRIKTWRKCGKRYGMTDNV